jgi:hypothetical protein
MTGRRLRMDVAGAVLLPLIFVVKYDYICCRC